MLELSLLKVHTNGYLITHSQGAVGAVGSVLTSDTEADSNILGTLSNQYSNILHRSFLHCSRLSGFNWYLDFCFQNRHSRHLPSTIFLISHMIHILRETLSQLYCKTTIGLKLQSFTQPTLTLPPFLLVFYHFPSFLTLPDFASECASRQINILTSQSFDRNANTTALTGVVSAISATGATVVVAIGDFADLDSLMSVAHSSGLTKEGYAWLLSVDSQDSYEMTPDTFAHLQGKNSSICISYNILKELLLYVVNLDLANYGKC